MHLDDERVQRLLHGELLAPALAVAGAHLAECSDCRSRLAVLEAEERMVFAALKRLDHPARPVAVAAVIAQAGRSAIHWRRWAAAMVLAVGMASAAYAIPGSPFRKWIDGARPTAPPQPAPVVIPPEPAGTGGIAVAPGVRLVIGFLQANSGSRAVIRLIEGSEVVVRAPTGAATYTSDVGRLVIDNRPGSTDFEIGIPRAAAHVEIRVAGKTRFLKEGSRSSGAGPFIVSLAQP